MNRIITKIAIIILLSILTMQLSAQPGVGISFRFSSAAGITAFPAGSTTQAVPLANQDDFGYLFAPVGMSVKFSGLTYTKFVVSTNGWLALVPTAIVAIPGSLSATGYLNTNQLSTYAGGYPIIAPFWDDIASSAISYIYTGGALWVRWTSKIDKTNAAAGNNFWVRIDGTTGVISYFYNSVAYTITGTPSASIGIAGACTGDYYSYNSPAASTWADSTIETSTIGAKPSNVTYTFTPFQLYDDCANAKDLSPLNTTCTYSTFNINNAITSGSTICATTDVADVWFKVTKPAGVVSVTVTTASASPACQSITGTSVEVFTSCGGTSLGCATTSVANPGFGEVTVARPCSTETLYIRVTSDGDLGGKFKICLKDAGAPTGTGATCGNATNICSLPYSQTGMTTAGFGADYDSANSVCHDPFMNGEDYVFSYTPTSNICIRISVNTTGANPGLFVFDGCPNLLATTHCIASSVNTTGNVYVNSVSLIAGTTYYFLVDNDTLYSAPFNIPFDINVTQVGTPVPAYDACGALNLGNIANNQACVFSTYTTECATPSALPYPAPTCGNFINGISGDVWLSFTATFTGSLLINTQPGAVNPASDIAMAIYSGNCITLTMIACDDNSAGSSMPLLSIPVTNGTSYYIRIWTVSPGNTGNFNLCLSSACSPPNDLPCAAVLVNLGGSATGFNTCAGTTGEPPNAAQCPPPGSGIINNVWYKAVVPASGSLKIRTHTHSLIDTQIEAFLFPTGCANAATSYISKGCNDDGPDCGPSQGGQSYHDFSELILSALTPGDTVFVAVDGFGSLTGTFDITIIDGAVANYPPISGADCDGANSVCGPSPITVNDPGILGYGNICDFASNYDCWANGERNSAWYRVTVNPGTLQFDIQTFSDYDFIMWDITSVTNYCALIQAHNLPSIRCNWVTTVGGHTGISIPDPDASWEPAITVTGTPHTYLICIDNWNPPFNITGYTLNWMGSPISTSTSSVTWQGGTDTLFSQVSNWGTPPCNAVPTCGIDAVVASCASGLQPTVNANMSVNNLTINSGGQLRIKSPFILDICGNFTNNGTLIAEPGSTVRFSGTGAQTINGTLTAPNSFANLDINKLTGTVTLNSNIDVSQNFITSNATSIFNINGKYMKVAGHFTNNNGATTFTGIGGSTVEFNGTTNANFNNLTGVITLNRVKMNKTTGKLYLLGINSTMNIDSALALTLGNIVTPKTVGAQEVNMKYFLPASITGNNALSFIDGRLRRKIANPTGPSSPAIPASYEFPVGDSLFPGGYEDAIIDFRSSTLINNISAYFNPWPGGIPPTPGPTAPPECTYAVYNVLPMLDNGYWTFERPTTPSNGRYSVTLKNTGYTNQTGANGWAVATATNMASPPGVTASWAMWAMCNITSTLTATKRDSLNIGAWIGAFNHLYATTQSQSVLPIELLYFTAEPSGEDVICNWETASETNNDHFIVERSDNGDCFEAISVKINGYGIGISSTTRKYTFTDHDLCENIRYYRLKQVDIDGHFSYSDPVAVNCKGNKDEINIYPNPSESILYSTFFESADGVVKLQWLDVIGQVVKEEMHDVVKGYNTVRSDIADLTKGVYHLRIKETGKRASDNDRQVKFLKN